MNRVVGSGRVRSRIGYSSVAQCVALLEKTPHKDPKQVKGREGGGDHLARSPLKRAREREREREKERERVFFPHVARMASFICPFACVCVERESVCI
jgi:hypothetical protein